MAKKLSKGAKLDLIVTELARVISELKKLSKQHADLAGALNKRSRPAKPSSKPAKRTPKKSKVAAAKPSAREAAKRPVLVQTPEPSPVVGRTGS